LKPRPILKITKYTLKIHPNKSKFVSQNQSYSYFPRNHSFSFTPHSFARYFLLMDYLRSLATFSRDWFRNFARLQKIPVLTSSLKD
jgi:hypothetical protein